MRGRKRERAALLGTREANRDCRMLCSLAGPGIRTEFQKKDIFLHTLLQNRLDKVLRGLYVFVFPADYFIGNSGAEVQ